jgi:hypothetical protein
MARIAFLSIAAVVAVAGCAGAPSAFPTTGSLQQIEHASSSGGGSRSSDALAGPRRRRAICPSDPSGTGLLTDGDFSQRSIPSRGYRNGISRGPFAPDWVVTGRTIDFVGPKAWPPAVNPYCSVDLDGTPGPGGIRHLPFATEQGASYTVTFQLSGNGNCGPTVKQMVVKAAGQSTAFQWDISSGNSVENGVWAPETWAFIAQSATTVLAFASRDPAGNCGAVVAAISVTQN